MNNSLPALTCHLHPLSRGFWNRWLLLLLLISAVPPAFARDFRPSMLPNGTRFNCSTCHFSSSGGGARNPFGQDVLDIVGGSGRVPFWSPFLASLDSDGDGFTNGEELGDPDGDGTPIPGATITNPGLATSKPSNRLPTTAFLRPTSGNPVARPVKLTIEASAMDADGTIARVELLLGTNIVATVTNAPFVFKLDTSALTPGVLDLGVRSVDDKGGVSPTARQSITLLPEVRIQTTGVTAARVFEMVWTAPFGTVFLVEASTNLTTWISAGSVTATATGANFTETQPPNATTRFYRVSLPE